MISSERPHILFVSHSIPPYAESQTIRNVFLLRGLNDAGFSVHVIGPPQTAGDASLERMLPACVVINRTSAALYDRVQHALQHLPGMRLRGILKAAVAVTTGRLAIPDARVDWAVHAISAARDIPRPDLIISSAGTNAAHIAASYLAGRYRVPWIADYGDPWTLNPLPPANQWYLRMLNSRLERATMKRCRAITVTTQETEKAMRDWLGGGGTHIVTVPCGYSQSSVADDQWTGNSIRFLYAGTAGAGGRDFRWLMSAINKWAAQANGVEVLFEMAGSISPKFPRFASSLTHMQTQATGWISYEESVRRMYEADILVLVGNRSRLQIPAKAFNYLASGRPILYIPQLREEEDPTWKLLAKYAGVVRLAREGRVEEQLADSMADYPRLRCAARQRVSDPSLKRFEWDNIGKLFATVAADALSHRL